MNEELLVNVISNLPNFAGFVFVAYVLSQNNDRYLSIIEKMIDNCLDDKQDAQDVRDLIK